MFSLRSMCIKLAVLLIALAATAANAQIDPNQIDWPTGASLCVYAPGTNTCVTNVPTATNLAGTGVDYAPYQSASATTGYIPAPTTSGHTYVYAWQPGGSAVAPTAVDANTLAVNSANTATTATNLASYPSLCTGSQFSQGLSSGSNNCATPAGGSGNYVNLGASVSASGCSMSGSAPYICTVTGSSVSSITISSIPGTYLNLKIWFEGTTDQTAAENVLLRFNSDAGSNYDYRQIYSYANTGSGTGVLSYGAQATTSMAICAAGQTGSYYTGECEITVTGYANTNWSKGVHSVDSGASGSPTYQGTFAEGGTWRSTAAITSFTLLPGAGKFSVNDTVAIYGTN